MAIIVDKVQKRKDIALACKELFFEKGINDLTISEVAKAAGVGKGTIYEYFTNKEEIVFEIVNNLLQAYNIEKKARIDSKERLKEKIVEFFGVFYREEDVELRQLYKEFISITLLNPSKEMTAFHAQCKRTYFQWFEEIIQEGITKGELSKVSQRLAKGLFVIGEGLFVSSTVTGATEDLKKELDDFYEAIFELMEVKK